jgi:hypothetical protein
VRQQDTRSSEWLAYNKQYVEVIGMKRLLMVLCVLALVVATANADVPDPSKCSTSWIPRRFLYRWIGHCASTFMVTVEDQQPINNVVEIPLGSTGRAASSSLPSQTLTANTDANGKVVFNIGGGGCNKNRTLR